MLTVVAGALRRAAISRGETVLVAVSGGPDSVALLPALLPPSRHTLHCRLLLPGRRALRFFRLRSGQVLSLRLPTPHAHPSAGQVSPARRAGYGPSAMSLPRSLPCACYSPLACSSPSLTAPTAIARRQHPALPSYNAVVVAEVGQCPRVPRRSAQAGFKPWQVPWPPSKCKRRAAC